MSSTGAILSASGGIGLFLLGIGLMSDGLRLFSGGGLQRLVMRYTRTPFHGLALGTVLTAFLQSSSAVTAITISFVNAGLMTLRNSLGVIFGANVGTTTTGWLVTMVGFDVNLKAMALPFIGLGVLLRLMRRLSGKADAAGQALAGFGLFFLGLDILVGAFKLWADSFGAFLLGFDGGTGILLAIGGGFLLTLLLQSSSAVIAITLSALAGGAVDFPLAACMVVGANLGTTSTAVLAVLGATPAARRTAAAHVLFNVLSTLIALLSLPWLLQAVLALEHLMHESHSYVVALALFDTLLNLLCVLLLLPFVGALEKFLNGMFHSREEDLSIPKYLDLSIEAAPQLGIKALLLELSRIRSIASGLCVSALRLGRISEDERRAVESLHHAVAEYVIHLSRFNIGAAVARGLPVTLRIGRYLQEMARLCPHAIALHDQLDDITLDELKGRTENFLRQCARIVENPAAVAAENLSAFQQSYDSLKAAFLSEASDGDMPLAVVDEMLGHMSHIRRMAEQAVKAERYRKELERDFDPPSSPLPPPSLPSSPSPGLRSARI